MTITPQDIQSKQFHVRLRGFDVDEVDNFLEKIAEEFLILSLENKQTLEKIESLEKEIANFRNKEQTFQSAILSAQKISDEMQEKSRHESEDILNTAKLEAEKLEKMAREEAEKLRTETRQESARIKQEAEDKSKTIVEDAQSRIVNLTEEINSLIEMKDRILSELRQFLSSSMAKLTETVPEGLNSLEPLPIPELSKPQTSPSPDAADHGTVFSQSRDNQLPESGLEDNLYEKIELPDEQITFEEAPDEAFSLSDDSPETLDVSDFEPLGGDAEQETLEVAIDEDPEIDLDPNIAIPDLDGDMLFTLEDPMDELEPSVSIKDDDKSGA